jgi:hypothetical protein
LQILSISKIVAISFLGMILVTFLAGLVLMNRVHNESSTTSLEEVSTFNFDVEIIYSSSWNATYYGWEGAHTLIANSTLKGSGSMNETISLSGNIYDGIRLDLTVQKADSTQLKMIVYVFGPRGAGTFSNSTSIPFGRVFIGIGVIA